MTKGARLLADWRKAAGFSTAKACRELELDQSRYNAFERGRKRPGLVMAKRIADGTGGAVPMDAWTEIESVEVDGAFVDAEPIEPTGPAAA